MQEMTGGTLSHDARRPPRRREMSLRAELQTHRWRTERRARGRARGTPTGSEGGGQAAEGHSQAWEPSGVCFAGFQTYLGPVTSEFLPFSPYACILRAEDLSSGVTGPQIEGVWLHDRLLPSPMPTWVTQRMRILS